MRRHTVQDRSRQKECKGMQIKGCKPGDCQVCIPSSSCRAPGSSGICFRSNVAVAAGRGEWVTQPPWTIDTSQPEQCIPRRTGGRRIWHMLFDVQKKAGWWDLSYRGFGQWCWPRFGGTPFEATGTGRWACSCGRPCTLAPGLSNYSQRVIRAICRAAVARARCHRVDVREPENRP